MNKELLELHAGLCKTLADPKRLELIYLLSNKEKSVSELVKLTGMRQANVSQHLAVLKQKNIVASRREGTLVYYCIAFPKMVKACNLIREVLLQQSGKRKKILEKE